MTYPANSPITRYIHSRTFLTQTIIQITNIALLLRLNRYLYI